MRRLAFTLALGLTALGLLQHQRMHAQVRVHTIAPSTVGQVRDWDNTVSRMLRSNELQVRLEREDTLIPERTIQQLDQYYMGIRVWGGGVSRQLDGPEALSVFGVLYAIPDIAVTPVVTLSQAKDAIEHIAGMTFGPNREPELVLWPEDNSFRLVWVGEITALGDVIRLFIDAVTGEVLRRDNILETQLPQSAYVGRGRGVLGDDKKISTGAIGGAFRAFDTLRPPDISTFDIRLNIPRASQIVSGFVVIPAPSDYALTISSNEWSDGAVVDAHVYSSYTYDYYFRRFGRRGLDNADMHIWNLVHLLRRGNNPFAPNPELWANAGYYGNGVMVYGDGCDCSANFFGNGSQRLNYFSGALDIVAHEITHGVTDYTSILDYQNESGALNESFSDIIGTSTEFLFQPAGSGPMKADYLIGEDVITAGTPGGLNGLRSMENPGLYGQPDNYNSPLRIPPVSRPSGSNDRGGVHINSGIPNHAFYLAIEGGTNRTSGIRVQGVGGANREQIEKIFYRAFAQLMPRNADFAMARLITLRAAQDLYGVNSLPYNAVRDAWTAVGVN